MKAYHKVKHTSQRVREWLYIHIHRINKASTGHYIYTLSIQQNKSAEHLDSSLEEKKPETQKLHTILFHFMKFQIGKTNLKNTIKGCIFRWWKEVIAKMTCYNSLCQVESFEICHRLWTKPRIWHYFIF